MLDVLQRVNKDIIEHNKHMQFTKAATTKIIELGRYFEKLAKAKHKSFESSPAVSVLIIGFSHNVLSSLQRLARYTTCKSFNCLGTEHRLVTLPVNLSAAIGS